MEGGERIGKICIGTDGATTRNKEKQQEESDEVCIPHQRC